MIKSDAVEDTKYYTCKYDRPFKEIMLNKKNEDILKILLKKILKVDIHEIIHSNIERNTGNLKIRRKYYDVLLKTDKGEIEIELNASNEDYVHPRNMAFISSLYASHTLVGEQYNEDTNIIQINLTYGLKDSEEMRIYKIQDKDGKKFVENFTIVEVNMDFYEEMWYHKNIKEINENKYFIMLNRNAEEQKEFESYIKDKKVVKRYMDELNQLNENPIFREYMSYEEDQRKIFNSRMRAATEKGLENGLKQGIEQGIEQGYNQKSLEVAQKMLSLNEPIDKIVAYTGLSIEQINSLK